MGLARSPTVVASGRPEEVQSERFRVSQEKMRSSEPFWGLAEDEAKEPIPR